MFEILPLILNLIWLKYRKINLGLLKVFKVPYNTKKINLNKNYSKKVYTKKYKYVQNK